MFINNGFRGHSGRRILNWLLFALSAVAVTALWPHHGWNSLIKTFAMLILVSSCYIVLYLFLSHFRSEVLAMTHKVIFILTTILVFVVFARLSVSSPDQNYLLLVPFALIPVIIRTFYDARMALFILLVVIMLAGLMVPDPFRFGFMNFISGMVAIFTLSNIYRKARLFFTALMVFLSYLLLNVAMAWLGQSISDSLDIVDVIMIAGNGMLVLLGYPIIFLFESKFLFLSDTTLLELADTNQPLLRKLAVEAPGSFQHSLQVANLAEEAARAVGANLLLVRTGSLYHDIGKIAYPDFYVENQEYGISPHESLNPLESVRVIINHVNNGVTLARNFKIPVQIIDFIRTHHGTTIAWYFYRKYTEQNPWDTSSEKEFTYPGPKPFSKETAVVMMADAVEASSRTLERYTEENISDLVERIIYLQEQNGQFKDVPLTFRDMSEIKAIFKKRLSNIYHSRILYPGMEQA